MITINLWDAAMEVAAFFLMGAIGFVCGMMAMERWWKHQLDEAKHHLDETQKLHERAEEKLKEIEAEATIH